MSSQLVIASAFAVVSAALLLREAWVSWNGRRNLRKVGGNENVFLKIEVFRFSLFGAFLAVCLWLIWTAIS